MKRRAVMAALLATMAALMTAPSLASTIAPLGVARIRDAAGPSLPPGVPEDGKVVPDAPESTEAEAPVATDTPTAPPQVELAQPSGPQAQPSANPPAPAIAPDPLVTQPTARAVAEAPATTLPAATAVASAGRAPAGREVGASGEEAVAVGGGRMPIDPFVVAGAIGLLVGIGLAAAWSMAMRRATIARVREAADAQSRASLAIEQRTLRRARNRSSHDLIVDAPARGDAPDRR